MTSCIYSLAAIHKQSGQFCFPRLANKKEEYVCPQCNKTLILRQGQQRVYHFAHHQQDDPCLYYIEPTETQVHHDAKLALKQLLEKHKSFKITRNCSKCKHLAFEWMTPDFSDCSIQSEYTFRYNDSKKIADIAVVNGSTISVIFEICHSHATNEHDRPEPWFEFHAQTLLNDINKPSIHLHCIRKLKCKQCIHDQPIHDLKDLQTFLASSRRNLYWNEEVLHTLVMNILKNNHPTRHLRFDSTIQTNREVLELFNPVFKHLRAVIRLQDNGFSSHIVHQYDYKFHDCWNTDFSKTSTRFSFVAYVTFDSIDTLDIIKKIIKLIHYYLPQFKYMKHFSINFCEQYPMIENFQYTSTCDLNDFYKNQAQKIYNFYNNFAILKRNNIDFTLQDQNIVLSHPFTNQKIQLNISYERIHVFHRGIYNLRISDLITWYRSRNDDFPSRFYYQVHNYDSDELDDDTYISLTCPFSEKDQVKELGARWKPSIKKWVILDTPDNRSLFHRWIHTSS